MKNGLNVSASMSLTNITSPSMAMRQYDRAKNEKAHMESAKSAKALENDPRYQQLNKAIDDLSNDIDLEEKQKQHTDLKKHLEKKKEELQNTYDAQTAKSVLKMEEFMQLAAQKDSNELASTDPSDTKEITDAFSEVNSELNADIKDEKANAVSETSSLTESLSEDQNLKTQDSNTYTDNPVARKEEEEFLGKNIDKYI